MLSYILLRDEPFFFIFYMNVSNFNVKNNRADFPLEKSEKGKFKYYCGRLRNIAQLVGKVALGILIFPLFFDSYRQWVRKSYLELKIFDSNFQKRAYLEKCAQMAFLVEESKKFRAEYQEVKEKVELIFIAPQLNNQITK